LHLCLLQLLLHLYHVLKQCQPLYIPVVNVLLKGNDLCLKVKDPLQVVASLQLQLKPPRTETVVVLLSLKESETLLLVG
jgi:hypothetical protein